MEQNEILKKKVGNIEPERNTLSEAVVTIVGQNIETEKSNGEKLKKPLLKVLVKHPDKEESIALSKIKLLSKDKVVCKSLWVIEDSDGNIQKGSALDDLISYFNVECLADIEGKQVDTVIESNDSSFLCLKLY